MDEDIAGAKRSVEKFSELLRYQLYDQQQPVPVFQEIEYLQSYIELQKTRSTSKLQLRVFVDPKLTDQLVYPLLFLPLVENAFKFVGGDYQMQVRAWLEPGQIKFLVQNSVLEVVKSNSATGGIGLENLSRRLKLLYPDKHHLNIEWKKEVFNAELSLNYEG
jgi:two-component system LytT family sensor kinase